MTNMLPGKRKAGVKKRRANVTERVAVMRKVNAQQSHVNLFEWMPR